MKKFTRFITGALCLFLLGTVQVMGQYDTPTIDGSIGSGEYGSHTSGENNIGNWYITWDATNLYIGIESANVSEGAVFYLGTRTEHPINGGTNSDGTLVGFNYDGTNFAELPFRAEAVFYAKNGYREYRTSNGSNGWSSNTSGFGSYSDNTDVREFSVPWSVVGGIPSSFAFFGYVTSSGGFVYNQVPSANGGGSIGTSARYGRYFVVNSTSDGSSMKPFSGDSYVFNSSSDISDFGSIDVYDFTMNTNGSTITRNSSASNNWTIDNELVVSDGTIDFNSTSSTASVDKINVSGGTLTLSGSGATTASQAELSSGTINTNSGLTVQSDGIFYQTGGTLNGDIELERTVSGDAGWRLLSLPITGGTVEDVSDDTPVQGVSGGDDTGFDSNFKLYDDSGAFEDPTDVSTAWGDGLGFALYFFDNTDNGSSELPVTLTASGAEPSSDVSVTLNSGAAANFTLVGNPFGSNFNTNSITETGGSISDNIQFWDDAAGTPEGGAESSTTGSYVTGDRTGDYIVAPWQGFFVETADASITGITLPTSGKTTSGTSGTFFSKTSSKRADLSFKLSSKTTADKALRLSLREYATLGFDRADASKLVPLADSYATMAFAGEERLQSVFSLPYDLEEAVEVPLKESLVGVSGEFTLEWDGMESLPEEWSLVLHDFETGENIDMKNRYSYTFEAAATAEKRANPLSVIRGPVAEVQKAKSSDDNRFGITIRPKGSSTDVEPETGPEQFTLDQNYPNPFNPSTVIRYEVAAQSEVTLEVFNVTGQKIETLVNGSKSAGTYQVTWDAGNLSSGIYYYRLTAGSQVFTRKMTLIK